MACDCPLVVSDIPAHRQLLDEESAIFVNPNDRQQIEAALRNVLADPLAAQRRAEKAKERIRPLSVKAMAQRYLEAYSTALNGSRHTFHAS